MMVSLGGCGSDLVGFFFFFFFFPNLGFWFWRNFGGHGGVVRMVVVVG